MAVVLVDTSILIDFYRKSDKERTTWMKMLRAGYTFAISTVTKYELCAGVSAEQLDYWNKVLSYIDVLPFDEHCVDTAIEINKVLKRSRKQIAIADLFIGATAVHHGLAIATLNKKHFERIENLHVLEVQNL